MAADEWDPEVWYRAFTTSLRALARDHDLSTVTKIVLTGQMQNLVLVAGGRAVGPAVLYFAQRPGDVFEDWIRRVGRKRIVEATHNTPDAGGFPAKFLWLQQQRPEHIEAAEAVLCGAHDYIAYRLTGTIGTDPTTASTTGLFDPVRGTWASDLFAGLPVDDTLMAPVRSADHDDGRIGTAGAPGTPANDGTLSETAELGLSPDVHVIHGVGDVGSSILDMQGEGMRRSIYLGTSGWVQDIADLTEPGDPEAGVFNLRHPIEPKLIRVAPLLTATGAFDWFVRTTAGTHPTDDQINRLYDDLSADAAAFGPSDCRVLFLPYLSGERSPFKDPYASGLFLGLRRDTTPGELFRAVEEGVAFAVRSIIEALDRGADTHGDEPALLSGGGTAVHAFPQLLATITRPHRGGSRRGALRRRTRRVGAG